ncbi:MAG: hypothetical protein P8R54_16380 [Myxococcota bacterium]|nr:hypothetical protein [Myxococcota bacterium]
MIILVEVSPVQQDIGTFSALEVVVNPSWEDGFDSDPLITEKAIDLFDRMLWVKPTSQCESLSDGSDTEGCPFKNTNGAVAEGEDTLGVQVIAEDAQQQIMDFGEPGTLGGRLHPRPSHLTHQDKPPFEGLNPSHQMRGRLRRVTSPRFRSARSHAGQLRTW